MRYQNERHVGDLLQTEFDELVWLLADADSHISWCRHRHGQSDQDQRELDEWLSRARLFRRTDSSPNPTEGT